MTIKSFSAIYFRNYLISTSTSTIQIVLYFYKQSKLRINLLDSKLKVFIQIFNFIDKDDNVK